MVGRFDDNDNTLGHIAALTGNSKLFKVEFICVVGKLNDVVSI